MNDNNLKSLKNRSESEKKEIARKGGKASAIKRKEKKETEDKVKDIVDILCNMTCESKDMKKIGGIFKIFNNTSDKQVKISALDLLLSHGLELIVSSDVRVQGERVKCLRLLYEMKQDSIKKEEREHERQFKRELALKELELKERVLSLEERKVKAREELINMKNRGAIDGDIQKSAPIGVIEHNLNQELTRELLKEIEDI